MKIRRIVVGLDPSSPRLAALETAAALASRMQAELLGLFIEDSDLLQLAGLPFAREVGFASAMQRALDVAGLERTLRALAADSERALAAAAARIDVPWSFRVARGSLVASLLAAAAEGDLLLVAAAAAQRSVGAPLALLCSTGTRPEQVLPAASTLGGIVDGGLRVLLLAPDATSAATWEHEARAVLGADAAATRFRAVPAGDATALRAALRAEAPGALLVAAPDALAERTALRALVGDARCPVFVLPIATAPGGAARAPRA